MSRENQMVYSSVSEEATHLILLLPCATVSLFYLLINHLICGTKNWIIRKYFQVKFKLMDRRDDQEGWEPKQFLRRMKKFGLFLKYPKNSFILSQLKFL